MQLSASRLVAQVGACGREPTPLEECEQTENISSPACPASARYCPSGERSQPRAGFRKEAHRWTRINFHRGRTPAFSPPSTGNSSGLAFFSWRYLWSSALRACNRALLHKLLTRHCEEIGPASLATNQGVLLGTVPIAKQIWLRVWQEEGPTAAPSTTPVFRVVVDQMTDSQWGKSPGLVNCREICPTGH